MLAFNIVMSHDLQKSLAKIDQWPFGGEALVEEYIPGRELTVAVLDSS